MSKLIRVVAAVIRRGDRLLVCQRPLHKRHGGLWEFPGGKCEAGETDCTAITRELLEELDVKVSAVGRELFSINDPNSSFLIVFIEAWITGEPICREHSALAWYSEYELDAVSLAPSDQRFVDALVSGAVSLENT